MFRPNGYHLVVEVQRQRDRMAGQRLAATRKRNFLTILTVFLILALIPAILILVFLLSGSDDGDSKETYSHVIVDCFPEANGQPLRVDEEACQKRGCEFNSSKDPDAPMCSYKDGQYIISVSSLKQGDSGNEGMLAMLEQVGKAPFGGDIEKWTLSVKVYDDQVLRFTFEPTDGPRYLVPVDLNLGLETSLQDANVALDFMITDKDQLGFKIVRKSTKTSIWNTVSRPGSLVLSDQFLQIMTILPSSDVYGLGEQAHDTFRHQPGKTWPAFARDQPPPWTVGANLYGVHPFYTCVEDEAGNTHGIFMFNSNAQDYSIDDIPSLTFRTIGGVLDFFVFPGPSPEAVVQQYTKLIGRPVMPPYWALGFQLCRYGYNNISNLQDAVESTKSYDIPHDVQYADIDHMDTRNIFTVDNENFPGLNDYFHELRDGGMRIIYILDPCMITNKTDFEPYNRMKAIDGNIKWRDSSLVESNYTDSNGAILGYVWPQGPVAFPDFFKNKTREVWKELIVDHRDTLIFDGLWIDMNEPASFGTNEERPFNWPEKDKPYFSLQCPSNSLDDPPYKTKAAFMWDTDDRAGRLSDKTICLDTVQGETDEYRHYDVHNLYGWSQTEPTLSAARAATGERSFVISRSTFPGSGQFAGHWLGDNASQWKQMQQSIIGILEFNLFGIPYIGADICGFFDDTTVELCKRWMQLGAFYPFSRNHNGIGWKAQGPGQMGDEVGIASREILEIRYQLLPYLYLLFHHAHNTGSTVVRPLHHEFPQDLVARSIDKQFMWGSCLLITPILEEGQETLEFYLPEGRWYDYLSAEKNALRDQDSGHNYSVLVNTTDMPLIHLRGGCVLALQQPANNTYYSRQKPLEVIAALDRQGTAKGHFFWDDGVSIIEEEGYSYLMVELTARNGTFSWNITQSPGQQSWNDVTIEKIVILGLNINVTVVHAATTDGTHVTDYFQEDHVLTVYLDTIKVWTHFSVTWA